MIDTMITKQDHHTRQTKTSLGFGEVTLTIHDRPQRRDKFNPLRISAVNPDQIHLILQGLPKLEIKTRTKLYHTTRNAHSNTGNKPNVVQYTTKDDEIIELSVLCPLHC